jgi:hypothetical protein
VINAFLGIIPNDPALVERIGTLQDVGKWLEHNDNGDPIVVIPVGTQSEGERQRSHMLRLPAKYLPNAGA